MTPTPKSADTSHVRPLMDIAMSLSEHLHLVQDRIDAAIEAQLAAPLQLDQNESDPGVLWAEIWRLRTAVAGPNGYATWQEAATAERVRRVEAERKLAAAAPQGVQAAPPPGFVLVPKEPTEEMHAAAVRTIVRCTGNDDFPPRVWRAMLAAAPAAPAQERQQPTREAPDGAHEALQRLIESGLASGPSSREDALLVAKHRRTLLTPRAAPSPAPAVQPTEAVARPSYDDLVWCLERIKEASTSAHGIGSAPAAPAQEPQQPSAVAESPSEFDEIRSALEETYRFASTSRKAQENINFVLESLDTLEAKWKGGLKCGAPNTSKEQT